MRQRQGLASGDAQLPLHEVQAGDHLGDRMLHLQSRVHFHEIKPAIGFGNELHRAGTYVANRPGSRDSRFTHRFAALGCHAGRGRFLDDFLVAALHGAVALEQIHTLSMLVGKHLDLNMSRLLQIAFDQHLVIAKAG